MNNSIILGHATEGDIAQKEVEKGMNVSELLNSTVMAGEKGTGKTNMLGTILKQIREEFPKIGVLMVRVLKRNPKSLFYLHGYFSKSELKNLPWCSMLKRGEHISYDISKYSTKKQKKLFLKILISMTNSFKLSDSTHPRCIVVIDDADSIFRDANVEKLDGKQPHKDGFLLRTDKFGIKIEGLMFSELKRRGVSFISILRNPIKSYRFILERSHNRIFFKLKPSWAKKLSYLLYLD